MVSPMRTITEPSACLANFPVSIEMVRPSPNVIVFVTTFIKLHFSYFKHLYFRAQRYEQFCKTVTSTKYISDFLGIVEKIYTQKKKQRLQIMQTLLLQFQNNDKFKIYKNAIGIDIPSDRQSDRVKVGLISD